MLERAIVGVGVLVGFAAGLLFHYTAQHRSLPALLFVIVDLFGVVAGSVVVGLLAVPIAIGTLVLLVDWIFPSKQGLGDH